MVCGASGLGKSTLINSLFLTDVYSSVSLLDFQVFKTNHRIILARQNESRKLWKLKRIEFEWKKTGSSCDSLWLIRLVLAIVWTTTSAGNRSRSTLILSLTTTWIKVTWPFRALQLFSRVASRSTNQNHGHPHSRVPLLYPANWSRFEANRHWVYAPTSWQGQHYPANCKSGHPDPSGTGGLQASNSRLSTRLIAEKQSQWIPVDNLDQEWKRLKCTK